MIDLAASEDEAGLVETPEARRNSPTRDRNRPFRRRAEGGEDGPEASATDQPEPPRDQARDQTSEPAPVRNEAPARETPAADAEVQAEEKPRAARRPRGPRKSKAESGDSDDAQADQGSDPRAAAE